MNNKILKVDEWLKAKTHQFEKGFNGSLIRISDGAIFFMGYGYNAYGYVAGTTIEIMSFHPNMIHVHCEIISGNDRTVCSLMPEINKLSRHNNYLYINPPDDCRG